MKFKCKTTKNIYEFTYEVDIKAMLEHPEYELIEEDKIEKAVENVSNKKK